MNFYNENDPKAAAWLRELIKQKLIPAGVVDERSITEILPSDLNGYTQHHFFCGIAGWSLALHLAGWPEDRPVWTGSCPCQPFSVAGKQAGFSDPRHLWPVWRELIRQCDPPVILGEQVASAAAWLRLVRSDLEGMGYAVGAMPIQAASANADHFRDRFWFVADHDRKCASDQRKQRSRELSGAGCDQENSHFTLADSDNARPQRRDGRILQECTGEWTTWTSSPDLSSCSLEHAARFGWGEGWTESEFRRRGFTAAVASFGDSQYIECPDGKWRRLPPPRVRWLGTGISARVAKLRGFGNAIDPRPAAEFIGAYLDVWEDRP